MKKYTETQFIEAVKTSHSVREVLLKLGLSPKGGNYHTFKKLSKKLNLDISHFKDKTHYLVPFTKKPLESMLVNNSITDGAWVKKRLLDDGIKDMICENCNLTEWLGFEMPLEIHHINGNSRDHRLENIRLLCPNCHHLTTNFRGRNIRKS
jgi:hypothetical protein